MTKLSTISLFLKKPYVSSAISHIQRNRPNFSNSVYCTVEASDANLFVYSKREMCFLMKSTML